jgi:hypothetical protein
MMIPSFDLDKSIIMHHSVYSKLILALALYTICIGLQAQSTSTDYAATPAWIGMIDNPAANYYEAIKAYDTYWQHHAKPEAENDIIAENLSRKERRREEKKERAMTRMTTPQREAYMQMKYQCKRFDTWIREEKPYVQEDGHILSQQERAAIWQQQQEEMRKNNK